MKISKKIANKLYIIRRRLGLVTADEYKRHLISVGVKIGKGTKFFSHTIFVDEQRPWMVEIGEYCKITAGVIILQHDYSRSVLRRVYGDVVGESKKTVIGNNVFIGTNAIILMGSHIGNNVIIGAGSVLSGIVPDNVVVTGNPARVFKTLDQHYEDRKKKYINEAKDTFIEFKKQYGREPSITEMGSFWPLYLEKKIDNLSKYQIKIDLSGDVADEVIEAWLTSDESAFSSYDEFKKTIRNNV